MHRCRSRIWCRVMSHSLEAAKKAKISQRAQRIKQPLLLLTSACSLGLQKMMALRHCSHSTQPTPTAVTPSKTTSTSTLNMILTWHKTITKSRSWICRPFPKQLQKMSYRSLAKWFKRISSDPAYKTVWLSNKFMLSNWRGWKTSTSPKMKWFRINSCKSFRAETRTITTLGLTAAPLTQRTTWWALLTRFRPLGTVSWISIRMLGLVALVKAM